MVLLEQQQQALDSFEQFLKGDNSIFILRGYAGTGKTTLIKPIVDIAASNGRTSLLMAPTGRAAKILSDKTKVDATTIHKGIYALSSVEIVEGDETSESKIEYRFPLRQTYSAKHAGCPLSPESSLIIIDEASMISSKKNCGDLFVFGTGILLDDIIKFARLDEGGKIIFVGDPAQLPPIGDPDSNALNIDYFVARGYRTDAFELTDVVRQNNDSTILKNSIKLREAINSMERLGLTLDRKFGEVEDIDSTSIAEKYASISSEPSFASPVVICFSNRMAAAYNNEIRKQYFPNNIDNIQVGDRLIIVGNNYSSDSRNVLNGEFAMVVNFSDNVELQSGFVYVEDGEASKKRIKLDLAFRDVILQMEDGSIVNKKILDTLLHSSQPNITYQEQCALMSNFNIRHRELKPHSDEYLKALMSDPYYNALRAKYGYAITCHKSQGGEWDTTFIDFTGRIGLSKDCLRWSYTAATRARNIMYAHSLHNIPGLKAKVVGISRVSTVPFDYFPQNASITPGPFHNTNDLVAVKAKYWQIVKALEGSGFFVSGIEHRPYREIYILSDADNNQYKFDATYNKAGIFKRFSSNSAPSEVSDLINSAGPVFIDFEYTPSNSNLKDLYMKIRSICDETDIEITNVVEYIKNYKVIFYLRTDAEYAYLEAYINKYGQVTYLSPRSERGDLDNKLINLIDKIKL